MKLIINFSKLDNNELLSLAKSVDANIKTLPGIEAVYSPFNTALEKCSKANSETIEKTMAKEESQLVQGEDDNRDKYSMGLVKLIEAHRYHPNAEVAAAAAEINQLIRKAGKHFYRFSYDKESVVIDTILTELENGLADNVILTGLSPYVEALRKSQDKFKQLRHAQISVFANNNELLSFGEVRNELETTMRGLFTVLPVLYTLNPTAEFKTAIGIIAETISKY